MDVGVSLPDNHVEHASGLVEYARRVESLGYDSVWLGEHWGWNAAVVLGQIAAETEEIAFGPAIANVFSRTPALQAMTAATLADLSGDRFRLGLGPSTPKIVENWHGLAYDRPLARTADTIRVVDRALAGERVDFEGDFVDLEGFTLRAPAGYSVPTYVAALGPTNRRLTGRFADGWLPHMLPFPSLESAFEAVADGATDEGREPDEIEIAPFVPIAVSEDESEARRRLAEHFAYYLGTNEVYKSAPSHYGFESEVEAIREAWLDGDRAAANEAVTDTMLDSMGVATTPDRAGERVAALADEGVDHVILKFPDRASRQSVDLALESVAAIL